MQNVSSQIKELNEQNKVRLAPSLIHGVGVVAIRGIKKGEKLYCSQQPRKLYTVPFKKLKKLNPEVRELVVGRWGYWIHAGAPFGSPIQDTIHILFVNHHDDPNYNAVDDTALRDIKSGEEVVQDYRVSPNWKAVYPWLEERSQKI